MMKSSFPRKDETAPAFAVNPDWKTTQASTFLKRAIFSSSSMWIFMVPAMVRTAPDPTPYLRVASRAASQFGMRGQSQVIVRGQVDDFLSVKGANRGLLIIEHTQLEV